MDYSALDDPALMNMIAQQHPDALSELYDRYSNLVFSVALRVVNERNAAEEITVDVFTRVWERASLYQEDRASVGTWLATLARHKGIDLLRRMHTHPEQSFSAAEEEEPSIPMRESGPEELAEIGLQRIRIRRAMASLPPEQRIVLEMAYYQGLTHREIGEKLGEPLGTIKTRLRLAMQKLRHSLADEMDRENGWDKSK